MFTNTLMKAWLVASCCMALVAGQFQSVELTGGKLQGSMATLETMVTLANPDAGGEDTITVRYTVPSLAWVGIGINPDGQMIGGEVVIGKPEAGTVLKYKLTAKSPNGIEESPNQTLLNTSLDQVDGSTILTFTKLLVEDGEFPIEAGTVNTFIAAFGSSNAFGFHQGYGVQAVNVPSGADQVPTPPYFLEQVAATGSYSTLLSLVSPEIQGLLDGLGPVTVFGPDDAVFGQVNLTGVSDGDIETILGAHVVPGVYTAADAMDVGCVVLESVVGTPIRVMYVEGGDDGRKLGSHMGGSTGYVMINEAKVILADVADDTSIFHGIDTVLLEEGPFECPEDDGKSFVEQVAETGEYTTLVGFIADPGLQAQLAAAGPITVFGPSDDAFGKVDLTGLSAAQLQLTLGSHVVSGVYTSEDVKAAGCVILTSVVGTKLRAMYVKVDHSNHHRKLASHMHEEDYIMINEGKVILADVADDTSIFHGLDTVLISTDTFECPTEAPAPTDAPAPTEAPKDEKKTDSASPSMIGGSVLLTALLSAVALIW